MSETSPQQTTKPAMRWLLKTMIITLVVVVLGVWGLYDALVAYPDRGREVASYRLFEYLEEARHPVYGFDGPAGVGLDEDPASVMSELKQQRAQLDAQTQDPGESKAKAARAKLALLSYLEALEVMFELTPEKAHIAEPGERHAELKDKWREPSGETRQAPKPLASYDIPVQWVFVLVGVVGGVWGTLFMARVLSKKYRWDPDTMRLTLPTGEQIVPEDVAEFDKRKWDKFLIFLKMKESHESLGGRELRIDLYRYDPLEDWIVQMHQSAFPEEFEDEDDDFSANKGVQAEGSDSESEAEPEKTEQA